MAVTGVQTSAGLPAPFLEPFAEKITEALATQLPTGTTDISAISPKVAAVSPLVQAAQQRQATQAGLGTLQFGPTGEITGAGTGTGVAAYEPYLQQAQALTAPGAYQQYMSPYQSEVIDATQRLLEEQRAAGRSQIGQQAVQAGAFGGGRQGVAEAEYERQRDMYDAGILADIRQKGLQQAQTLQQQALANQLGLGEAQQTFESGIVSGLGSTGAGAQAYSQSILDAIRQGNVLAETFPTQQIASLVQPFGTLLSGAVNYNVPQAPIAEGPGLTAAKAFGSVFGPVLGGQKTSLAGGFLPQQQQQQQQTYGLGSLLGYA